MRLIDADALYREVKTECNPYGKPTIGFDDGKKVLELIDAAPTIEPEVRHGRWIKQENGANLCSVCGVIKVSHLPFCGHCGAKMDATDTNVGGKGGADNG